MISFLTTIILRHRKENLNKCSLRGLETREDMQFIRYPFKELPDLSQYFTLSLDGEVLSEKDRDLGIFLIDATWRHALTIEKQIPDFSRLPRRSLPKTLRTAYPRRQEDCSDPNRGLASVEALYMAYHLLGRDTTGILDFYYWKSAFLEINALELS